MKNSLSLYHTDLAMKKENTSYRKYRAMVNDILEDPQQNILISQILSAPETRQPHRGRQSELKKKAKNADLGRYKFKMPNKCSCEHDSAKKVKGRRQRS